MSFSRRFLPESSPVPALTLSENSPVCNTWPRPRPAREREGSDWKPGQQSGGLSGLYACGLEASPHCGGKPASRQAAHHAPEGPAGPARAAHARQNRERILQAAWESLLESNDASLNSIAKKAGVGIGTLYRHFPTREALVLEVYRHEVEQSAAAAPALLTRLAPLDALREWMERLAQYGMTKVGLADALASAASHESLAAESYEPIIGALSLLLQANEAAGTIRPGLDPDDVLLMMGFLWRIDPQSDWRTRSGRLLDLLIDGLRAGAPEMAGPAGAAGDPPFPAKR